MAEGYRKYHRYQIFGAALLIPRCTMKTKPIASRVNNISQGGMGLYTKIPLEMDTEVCVELSFLDAGDRGEKSVVNGKVASLAENDEQYFVGISFDTEISYDRFMKMISWY